MSDHRLRQGRKVLRTLYLTGEQPSDGDQLVGMVDTPELAAEIVAAVNARRDGQEVAEPVRTAILRVLQRLYPDVRPQGTGALPLADAAYEFTEAVMGALAPSMDDQTELERLRAQAACLSGAVWVVPGLKGGRACVGGTRVPAADIADLMADGVGADQISEYYPSITADGAAAAHYFADRFVDRHARSTDETDPRTEVEAHAGGDPERIVQAWEQDRAELAARYEAEARQLYDDGEREIEAARGVKRIAMDDLERAKAVAEHWRFHAVTWPDPLNAAAHPLCMVLAALNGETDPEQLGMAEGDIDAALARARQLAGEGQ